MNVAVANAGAIASPNPIPISTSDGRTCEAYGVSTPIRVSSSIPSAPVTIPSGTSGRGPVSGRILVLTTATVGAIEKLIGRNARPVSIALKPFVVLQVERQEQQHPEQPGGSDPDGQERAAAVAVGDDAQRQQRLRRAALPGHEQRRAAGR